MDLLYTVTETGAVVFAERARAESVARLRAAFEQSSTWGELRSRLEPAELSEVLRNMDLQPVDVDPEAPFDPDDVPGYADGDYPEWLQQTMLQWFPAELIPTYGQRMDSVLNGEFLQLPAHVADEVADLLRQRGHAVTRSDLRFS